VNRCNAFTLAVVAAAGFALGACGGTLYDPDHVPVKEAGGLTCSAGTHACGGVCVAQDVNACGSSCQACGAAPANATETCAPSGGDYACRFRCDAGWFTSGDGLGCRRAGSVFAGGNHACAALTDGSLSCWGANDSGQLGANVGASSLHPVRALPFEPNGIDTTAPGQVALGLTHTCAIQSGTVKCWGANFDGQLGTGDLLGGGPTPVIVALPGARRLAAGRYHTCALVTAGGVTCWGWNASGQLGLGSTFPDKVPSPTPSLVASGASDVAANAESTCALVGTKVMCFGANGFGQVGNGSTTMQPTPDPVLLPTTGTAVPTVLAVGGQHACAGLTPAGQPNSGLYCWGDNSKTQLGSDTFIASFSPTPIQAHKIDGNRLSLRVIAGDAFTCTSKDDAEFKCQGANDQGQIPQTPIAPTAEGGFIFTSILSAGAGLDHGCVLDDLAAPAVKCWGANAVGQLGRPTSPAGSGSATPDLVGP
jgi:alpha-tubulin suppressor-like RCC1 family protein